MTAPRAQTIAQTAKPAEEKKEGLSAKQIAAGALASVTTTVVASSLGVAGTLIGAGLGSVVSTVAAAAYSHSLEKGASKLTKVTKVLPGGQVVREETRAMPALPPVNGKELPKHLDPRTSAHPNRKRWIRLSAYALGMFVLVMGVITVVEFIGQKPVSALVGGTETTKSTTLGAITNTSSSSKEQPKQEPEQDPATPSAPTTAPSTEESDPTTTEEEPTTKKEQAQEQEESTEETEPATPTTSSKRTTAPEPTTDSGTGSDGGPAADEGGSSNGTQQEPAQGDN